MQNDGLVWFAHNAASRLLMSELPHRVFGSGSAMEHLTYKYLNSYLLEFLIKYFYE